MQRLRAITPPLLTLKTNSQPFVVRCEGFVSYLCKTALTPSPLICETLCACFLRDWSCPTPPFAFVEMSEELMPPRLASDYIQPFFGSLYLNDPAYSVTVDDLYYITHRKLHISRENLMLFAKLLRVALFDLWVGNRDRHSNNPNILIYMTERNLYDLYPIDHEKCFCMRQIVNGILADSGETLHPAQTLLDTPFIQNWFAYYRSRKSSDYILQFNRILEELTDNFPIYIEKCRSNFENYLYSLPQEWMKDFYADNRKEFLYHFLFDTQRNSRTWETFYDYLTTERG